MRLVLETYEDIYVRHFPASFTHHRVGLLQALAYQPFLRRKAAYLLEVALECGEAPTGIAGKILERELVHVVPVHEVEDVYLPGLVEVEQRRSEAPVGMQQREQSLLEFQLHEIGPGSDLRIKEGRQRGEETPELGRVGQLDYPLLQLRRIGRELSLGISGIHLLQEAARETHEDSAVPLAAEGTLVHRDMVVARDEHALPLACMDTAAAGIEHHFPGTYIVQRELPGAVYACALVIVVETVEDVLVVEYEVGVFLFHCVRFPKIAKNQSGTMPGRNRIR